MGFFPHLVRKGRWGDRCYRERRTVLARPLMGGGSATCGDGAAVAHGGDGPRGSVIQAELGLWDQSKSYLRGNRPGLGPNLYQIRIGPPIESG
ncbi:hypothetical protein U1Q18_005480 [Sarracenia purpurea var. burkii]